MKLNPDTLIDAYIKLGIYDKLRKKIKTILLDGSLDDKSCIDRIRELLIFLTFSDCGE